MEIPEEKHSEIKHSSFKVRLEIERLESQS